MAAIYALAVFVGFTITGLGMSKKVRAEGGPRYLLHLVSGAISFITVLVLSVTKFVDGTWLVVIGTPIVLLMMKNFNHRYNLEQKALLITMEDSRATSIVRHDVTVLAVSYTHLTLPTKA